MARRGQYEELILRLGDLARERLVRRPDAPRGLERVLRAEEALENSQRALDAVEEELNRLDREQQARERAYAQERRLLGERASKSKKAVALLQGQLQELERKLSARRAELRAGHQAVAREAARQADADGAQQSLKKLRLAQLRLGREVEELESRVDGLLRAGEGPGEDDGVRAFRRLFRLDAEAESKRAEFEAKTKALEAALAEREDAVQANQEFLDKAVFLLGEECFEQRVADPLLAALYPPLEKLRRA